MAAYILITDLWLDGNLVEAGTEVELSDEEAKYIRGSLKPKAVLEAVEPEPVVETAKRKSAKVDSSATPVEVTDGVAG